MSKRGQVLMHLKTIQMFAIAFENVNAEDKSWALATSMSTVSTSVLRAKTSSSAALAV